MPASASQDPWAGALALEREDEWATCVFFFLINFIWICCTQAFSVCNKQELLFVVVCRLLIAVTSLVEHGF